MLLRARLLCFCRSLMTDAGAPAAELSVIAELTGTPIARVYELFRLPSSPAPVAHVACVPVYDIAEASAFIRGEPITS